jgi:hypothetical protein
LTQNLYLEDGEKERMGEGGWGEGEGKKNYKIDTCCYSTTMSSGYYKTSTPKKIVTKKA